MDFSSLQQTPAPKRMAAYVAIVALGGAMGGYAIHEHHTAKNLTAQNEQIPPRSTRTGVNLATSRQR